jgi:hypothetical protein
VSLQCPYCDRPARLVKGRAIYPHRPDLAHRNFWRCDPCDAHVGCHNNGTKDKPLGRLANAELRRAKQAAHAAFDPLWKSGAMKRKEAYAWLAESLGIAEQNTHIGMFDVDSCRAVVAVVAAHASREAPASRPPSRASDSHGHAASE